MSLAVYRHVLESRRRGLAIWAASISVISGFYTGMYPMMDGMDISSMMEAMPPAMIEALGYDDMASAAGYVGAAVYGLVAFALLLVFTIGAGARLLGGQEEAGELELELTSPLPRSAIYAQRLGVLWTELGVVVGALFVMTLAMSLGMGFEIPVSQLLAASLQLWLAVGFFGSVAFAAGAATGRRRLALGLGAALTVVSWMFNAIGPSAGLDWMATVSPIGWYMDNNPITRGFKPVDATLLVAASVVSVVVGWVRFRGRDLMT